MLGYVSLWPGAENREFKVQRGVRQRDPVSPVLFNLVLDEVLKEVGVLWKKRRYSTNVGQSLRGDRLTHIAFADDQALISGSWLSMRRMLLSLRVALQRRGLSLHPSKLQVQTNLPSFEQHGDVQIV